MELLPHQTPYTGPAPRYSAGTTVYWHGQAYTVERVVGRAPGGVGWVYELDGPAELIRVGEGEISTRPIGHLATTPGQDWIRQALAQAFQATTMQALYGSWMPPAIQAAAQQAADEERNLCILQALSGQPLAVCRAALQDYIYGTDHLIDQLKAGTVTITPDGDIISTNYRPYDHQLLFSTQVVPIQAQTRTPLNRAARRANPRPWSPPAR